LTVTYVIIDNVKALRKFQTSVISNIRSLKCIQNPSGSKKVYQNGIEWKAKKFTWLFFQNGGLIQNGGY
jgi:hypothetical protein